MLVDDLMRRLYADLDVEGEREGELYALRFEDGLALNVLTHPTGLELRAPCGTLPEQEPSEELFVTLLLANLLGQGTGGATLGLNAQGTHVTLSLILPETTSYADFRQHVETFLNYLAFWTQKLEQAKTLP